MAKGSKFHFTTRQPLTKGSTGANVERLQNFLVSMGYLHGSYHPGTLCGCTQRALKRYQRYYHLEADGVCGSITMNHMEQPRCGVPDIPVVQMRAGAPYVLRGCQYQNKHLRYAFLNGTDDLIGESERDIVRQGFSAWEGVADLSFEEVGVGDSPDFRIAWHHGNHGDGESFDGPGNTLAHAFFPPPCGGINSGDLHFDDAEHWINHAEDNGILLLQVAIHEIGHLLGLSHSQDQSAIMFAYYSPDRTMLAQDDIAGVQALYGPPSTTRQVRLTASDQGHLDRTADESIYEVEIPVGLEVSVDGPSDADFDLYIRKGAPPTEDDWDYRAYTVSSDESIRFPAEPGSKYFVMVRSYDGEGDYLIKMEPTNF